MTDKPFGAANKSCLSCICWDKCDHDRQRRCRVWNEYSKRVIDLLLWKQEKEATQ